MKSIYRRSFLMSLAGGAGVGALMAATSGSTRETKVRIVDFDPSGKRLGVIEVDKVVKTDAEWHKQLTAEQFEITRREGTEPAGSGKYAFKSTRTVCKIQLHLLQHFPLRLENQVRIGDWLAELLPADREGERC